MARATVAIPVYNGEAQLEECIACVTSQTLQDIEILICDNASSDSTPQIAQEAARRDPRIRVLRQPSNIGAMPNFTAAAEAATSDIFMWRAHDDLSSANYVEAMVAALEGAPHAQLAAPTMRTIWSGDRPDSEVAPIAPHTTDAAADIEAMLRLAHAGWFYGAWRTQSIRQIMPRCWREFPHNWAFDFLALYPPIVARAVIAVPEAVFIQRIVQKPYRSRRGTLAKWDQMVACRRAFRAACETYMAEADVPAEARAAVAAATRRFADARVFPLRKVVKAFLKQSLGAPGADVY